MTLTYWLATKARPAPDNFRWEDCPDDYYPVCVMQLNHFRSVGCVAFDEYELLSFRSSFQPQQLTWYFAKISDVIEVSNLDTHIPEGQVARMLAEMD